MVNQYVFSLEAEIDLFEILLYTIEQFGEKQADNYRKSIINKLELLISQPEMYALRDEFNPSVRIAPHEKHLIIYNTDRTRLFIIRILHENMDIIDHLV